MRPTMGNGLVWWCERISVGEKCRGLAELWVLAIAKTDNALWHGDRCQRSDIGAARLLCSSNDNPEGRPVDSSL